MLREYLRNMEIDVFNSLIEQVHSTSEVDRTKGDNKSPEVSEKFLKIGKFGA
jgi:hypothetical protein